MFSVSRIAFALALLMMMRCGSPAESAAVTKAPQIVNVPVGPLPGPSEANTALPANPFADDKRGLAEGRLLYVQYNCYGCHGDHGGGGMGPSLRDASWIYGGSDALIAKSIAEGRAYGMPAWGEMLTPAQIWQITAYIKSMRTRHEPQAPIGSWHYRKAVARAPMLQPAG